MNRTDRRDFEAHYEYYEYWDKLEKEPEDTQECPPLVDKGVPDSMGLDTLCLEVKEATNE